jgi:hypothetical protein
MPVSKTVWINVIAVAAAVAVVGGVIFYQQSTKNKTKEPVFSREKLRARLDQSTRPADRDAPADLIEATGTLRTLQDVREEQKRELEQLAREMGPTPTPSLENVNVEYNETYQKVVEETERQNLGKTMQDVIDQKKANWFYLIGLKQFKDVSRPENDNSGTLYDKIKYLRTSTKYTTEKQRRLLDLMENIDRIFVGNKNILHPENPEKIHPELQKLLDEFEEAVQDLEDIS